MFLGAKVYAANKSIIIKTKKRMVKTRNVKMYSGMLPA